MGTRSQRWRTPQHTSIHDRETYGREAANACILRVTPKIKWEKDRGKEPHRTKEDFPWFWGWDEETSDFRGGRSFDGNRWNDLHYSSAIKRDARDGQNPTKAQAR